MTINELDQGLRNLIASQPMVTAGVNGEVINGINSLIDAYRNLSFRVQSYPCQDVMKFGLTNEIAKLESNFAGLATQVLQERGINIMLYIPRTGAQYGPMMNGYGMVNTAVDPSVMIGQMMYNAPMTGASPMMPMPNAMVQPGRPMPAQPTYAQAQPVMSGLGVPNFQQPRPMQKHAPTFPGYAPTNKPVKLEPGVQSDQAMKTRSAPQSKIKAEPKRQNPMVETKVASAPVEPVPEPEQMEAAPPSPAEMLMGGGNGGGPSKSQGRDYLMELLKK
ncbi:MAG: hypothetical protein IJ310_01390 [Clostridia bacterium]|nr:hypothetical protein [Clostridiales bacterium]MBQ7917451.1 hypothetical protein [Clostridia bacterium]